VKLHIRSCGLHPPYFRMLLEASRGVHFEDPGCIEFPPARSVFILNLRGIGVKVFDQTVIRSDRDLFF